MNRAWAYIISKELNENELNELKQAGQSFVAGWTAHENQLSASFEIVKGRIIVVRVNEDVNSASGCSIDKLTRFIKETESRYSVELLNRLLVAYKNGDAIQVTHSSKVKELLSQQQINENTPVFNTALANDHELQNWEQPLKNTWLSKYLA